MTTRVDICNRALARIAELPIQSEEAEGAAPVLSAYDDQLDILLGLNRWSFATKTAPLSRLAAAPTGPWDYAFQLPGDRLQAPDAIYDSADWSLPFKLWELVGDTIESDATALWARYRFVPSPLDWQPLFRQCVILAIAAHLAVAMKEDIKSSQYYLSLLDGDPRFPGDLGLLARAKAADAMAHPSPTLTAGDPGPLITTRY